MPNRLLAYFECSHLPRELRAASAPFGELAKKIDRDLQESAEKTAGLRKLLEAKDCIVRATIDAQPKPVAPESLP